MIYACWLLEMFDFRNRPFRRIRPTKTPPPVVRMRARRSAPPPWPSARQPPTRRRTIILFAEKFSFLAA